MTVLEVDRPNRQVRPWVGKSDALDAIAAASAVLAGEALGAPNQTTHAPSRALPQLVGSRAAEPGPTRPSGTRAQERHRSWRCCHARHRPPACPGLRPRVSAGGASGTSRTTPQFPGRLRARSEVFDVAASNDTKHLSKHQRQLLVDLEAAQLDLTRYGSVARASE